MAQSRTAAGSYQVVFDDLKTDQVRPVYLFFGEEDYLQELVLKELLDKLIEPAWRSFNYAVFDARNLEFATLAEFIFTMPMFGRKVAVIRDAFKSPAAFEEKLAASFSELPPANLLVLLSETVDQRKKLFKAVAAAGRCVEFKRLRAGEASAWLGQRARVFGLEISPEAAGTMIEYAGNDLRQLEADLSKAIAHAGPGAKKIGIEDVSAVVGRTSLHTIFELGDAIGRRRPAQAAVVLKDILASGETPVYVLVMLARHFRQLLQARVYAGQGLSGANLAAAMGVHPFVAMKTSEQARNFSEEELESALARILQADIAVKTGKSTDPSAEVQR
ncbi:MAG: DNA polymerase III subunit delta, partial [Syntrophothermus sp.]